LVLPDDGPLDSLENQKIMNDAFERSNGAADSYTWDASGYNDYGYDPYALDYEISNLTDYQIDDYYENLDFYGGDPYAAYDQLEITDTYAWDDSGYVDYDSPDEYWDEEGIIGGAEEFDIYGGLEAIGGDESAEEFLNSLGIADLEISSPSGMMDLPLERIERDYIATSEAKTPKEVRKILIDLAVADGADPLHDSPKDVAASAVYIGTEQKLLVGAQFDNIMMGEGVSWNEIAPSVEAAYMKGEMSLKSTPIKEYIASSPEPFTTKSKVAEVEFGLFKPYNKDVVSIDGRPTHRYHADFTRLGDGTQGMHVGSLDTIMIDKSKVRQSLDSREETYEWLKEIVPGFSISEHEALTDKQKSDDALHKIDTHEGYGHRRRERIAEFEISDALTSDFFEGGARQVEEVYMLGQDREEIAAYFAALAKSKAPQMDLIMWDMSNQSTPPIPLADRDIENMGMDSNDNARRYIVNNMLNSFGYTESLATAEAYELGDGYITDLEVAVVKERIPEYFGKDYFYPQVQYIQRMSPDKIRETSAAAYKAMTGKDIIDLPPMPDDGY